MKYFIKGLATLLMPLFLLSTAFADIKVGFIYVGPTGDHGWTYMHDEGRKAIEKEFGDQVTTTYVESVKYGPDAERVMTQMAMQGYDMIFATSFGYMEQMKNVAKMFPDIKFEHATGYSTSDNMAVYSSKFYQGRYIQDIRCKKSNLRKRRGWVEIHENSSRLWQRLKRRNYAFGQ